MIEINISNIENGLEYLSSIIEEKADLVIPTARKGVQVLELLPNSRRLFLENKVLFFEAIEYCREDIKDKRIILFDDSVNSGNTLNLLEKKLKKYSIKHNLGIENKISTMALLVNREARYYPKYYPDWLLVDNRTYDVIFQELNYILLSSGKPMDIDHLVIKLKLKEKNSTEIKDILKKEFFAEELDHSNQFNELSLFTIDYRNSFLIKNIEGCPRLFNEGPRKLRLYITNNVIYIVPIIYPAMEICEQTRINYKGCPIYSIFGKYSLCDSIKYEKKDDNVFHSMICYICIINALNLSLVSNFLLKLKKHTKFELKEIDTRNFQFLMPNERRNLSQVIIEQLNNSLYENHVISFGTGKAEDIEYGVLFDNFILDESSIKLESFDDIEKFEYKITSDVIVSILINDFKDCNKSLFKYDDFDRLSRPSEGLTYNQIFEIANEEYDINISKGLDKALDIGFLKPLFPLNGMSAKYKDREIRVFSRLYSITSEEVNKSLICFKNLIT